MIASVKPGKACGTVKAPPSKSMAHRMMICAGLSRGESRVRGVIDSQDMLAAMDCLKTMGCALRLEGEELAISGCDPVWGAGGDMVCRESGNTLRFFIPLALISGKETRFTGWGRLMARPQEVYETLCRDKGMVFRRGEGAITVQGPLQAGEFRLTGSVSSQFISGLLFALPLLTGDSRIVIEPPFESRSYVELTRDALREFGVETKWESEYTLFVPGGQSYRPQRTEVEGDWSNGAFLLALNAMGGDVEVTGLRADSGQGDRVVTEHLAALQKGRAEIDLTDCPDLGPVLMAVAAAHHGAVFTGTRRLAMKESDRGQAMAQELAAFGVPVTVEENEIRVEAATLAPPSRTLHGHNDHRIVQALLLLLLRTGGSIDDALAVEKTYPAVYAELRRLGIEISLRPAADFV